MRGGRRPFDAVRAALHDISRVTTASSPRTRLDPTRLARTGVPEVVLAGGKDPVEVAASLRALAAANGRALASRCSAETAAVVEQALADDGLRIEDDREARCLVVAQPGASPPALGGRVGVITAGSSDAPVAAEAAVMAREMGATVEEVRDVGVAGLHRLVQPLEGMVERGVDVIVVVAGMDGALPSVVAGLVAVPVIGLPTSTGYGCGGGGVAALMSMLQSCAPGLVVVNIDNGIGAGATAALIANRVAAARLGLTSR